MKAIPTSVKAWTKKQKSLHRELYLQYRKKELLWYLDIFLSVNHPNWAVKNFLTAFESNQKTIAQLFTRVLICGGELAYCDSLPYENDLQRVIGFMLYRQYIEVNPNMLFRDIMELQRVFKLTQEQRYALRDKLLQSA